MQRKRNSGADLPAPVGFEGPPCLSPRAQGFLMTGAKTLMARHWCQDPNWALFVRRKSVPSLVVAPIASELMPGQGQFDELLPVGAFGRRGALHRRLGFMLWVVLRTHEANFSRPIWTSAWQFRPYDCGGRKSHRRARFRTMLPRRILRTAGSSVSSPSSDDVTSETQQVTNPTAPVFVFSSNCAAAVSGTSTRARRRRMHRLLSTRQL